jgi:opacity protein-like surface antigen
MIYGTGGIGYTRFEATVTITADTPFVDVSNSETRSEGMFGAVVGGGISTFVSDNAAVSLEALYYKFEDSIDFDVSGANASVALDDAFSVMMKFSIRAD